MTVETALGDRVSDPNVETNTLNPGWFFVFKERPGQIKFGLDDYADAQGNTEPKPTGNPQKWDDLTWDHLVVDRNQLKNFQLNFGQNLRQTSPPAGEPNAKWGDNSADLASILFQDPVLYARHACEMLP